MSTLDDAPTEASVPERQRPILGHPTPSTQDFLPHSSGEELPGKLIVIEGGDGSGRSTQIRLLHEWLEWTGFAVQTMGLRRSRLMGKDLKELAQRNELQRTTNVLLYATDFYDQIENRITPALRAGFVVLADRYTLTLMCRARVRGLTEDYLNGIFAYVPEPALRLMLDVPPEEAFDRFFAAKQQIDHWECGGDLNLASNLYESFITYQRDLRHHFDTEVKRKGYRVVDGARSVADVNEDLRGEIGEVLGIQDLHYTPSDKLQGLFQKR